MENVNVKRIYEPYSKADGYRILVDRLWPRGMKKEEAHIDKWMKEVAPSTELRKCIHADPGKWPQFITAYHKELETTGAIEELQATLAEHPTVTLLYAAKDETQNHALVLLQFINDIAG